MKLWDMAMVKATLIKEAKAAGRSFLERVDGIGGVWLTSRVIDSTYVDDCYVYRMNL
jgi:hypothetical protein